MADIQIKTLKSSPDFCEALRSAETTVVQDASREMMMKRKGRMGWVLLSTLPRE
jgi:hypothetical protein